MALFAGHAVTTDTIGCGVHFLASDPLDAVARKAVRVNVSDLVAKGCRPVAMTLASAWHDGATEADHAAFAAGLAADLAGYGVTLLGGDTTRLPPGQGPVFTVTMLGAPLGARVPDRAGARAGDAVLVTGTIGDAWLGLRHLTGRRDAAPDAAAVIAAYRTPAPPVRAAALIAEHATAGLDVSDGLVADARHLACASGLRVVIEAEAIPLSRAGHAFVAAGGTREALCAGGDDYQALVTAGAVGAAALEAAGATRIGRCEAGTPEVRLLDRRGRDVTPEGGGFVHF